MSLTGDLLASVLADAGVSALLADRVFDLYVPEDTAYPYATLTREGMMIEDHLDGKTSLRQSQYAITVVSETSISGEAIEEALLELLASTRGTIGTSNVRNIYYQGSTDSFIPPVDGSEESIHLIELSFEVHWLTT